MRRPRFPAVSIGQSSAETMTHGFAPLGEFTTYCGVTEIEGLGRVPAVSTPASATRH
jgi:hypothetical protein